MHLLQIVPGLPPRIDGIGDYALRLAPHLRDEQDVETRFLVTDPGWKSDSADGKVEGFAATAIGARRTEKFLEAIAEHERQTGVDTIPLLIHFSPYSYQIRGVPLWLVHALERRHAERPGSVHMAIHELEDHSLNPTRSVFWLSGVQRALIRRVARIANYRYTNSELSRRKLEDWGTGRFNLIFNLSTMAEPEALPPYDRREPVVVVFGRGAQRSLTYQSASHALAAVCRSRGATRIIDIGERLASHTVDAIDGIPIERTGRLSADEVVARMTTAQASFIHYAVPMLTKSSVYAVSASTGTLPYVFEPRRIERSCPGLITGEDFIPVPHSLVVPQLENPAALSRGLFERYAARNARYIAARIAQGICAAERACSR